jgi:hypothetical protein
MLRVPLFPALVARAHAATPLFAALTLALALTAVAPVRSVLSAQATGTSAAAAPAAAPAAGTAGMTRDELTAFAKLEIAISVARDSAQFQLSLARNKTPALQQQLRDKLAAQIAELIRSAGTTEAEYQRKTYLVATNANARSAFDALIAKETGVPTPGQVIAPPVVAAAAAIKVPEGPVGTHVGHVVNSFFDTPMNQGLLPVAMKEAATAAQHAALSMRTPTNLDAMKMHAGHVINAIDPSIVAAGPGLGYGLKKAANGVAAHIELAAKSQGASPTVTMHAAHVATAARATVTRAEQAVALAKQIQEATSAADAAALTSQLASLTAQLTAGVDANGDGKIGWQEAEGGLQQAQEHVNLLLAGEAKKP